VGLGQWELIVRLAVSGVLGGAIGLEREVRNHPAGIRPHALVAVGAALFTLAGAYGFGDIHKGPNVDPARVAAQVVTGIGFIGAGCIIKHGMSVRGLTTAATLWLSAALGVVVAAGAYLLAPAGAAVIFVVLVGFRLLMPAVLRRLAAGRRLLRVEYERGHGTLGPLLRELEKLDGRVGALHLEDEDGPGRRALRRVLIEVRPRRLSDLERLVDALAARPEVRLAASETRESVGGGLLRLDLTRGHRRRARGGVL
jgi:putative Mg2+ transporter-C (MgtC) family protein